ncbi:MAG TPA: ATP-binding protein [Kofleriaceae bacterium]|nr:ATP-binding protein [Kofleriaceae bacterium]
MPKILDDVTRSMLEAMPFGVIVLTPDGAGRKDGHIAFANQRAIALVGRELAGRPLAEAIAGDATAGDAIRFLDSILESLPAMVFVKRAEDLRFVRFNRAGEELLGLPRTELLGRNDYDFFPAQQADFFVEKDRKVLAQGHVEDIPAEPIETPRGTRWLHTRKIPIIVDDVPRYLLGVSIDTTDVRDAEAALRTSHGELERRVAERTAALEREVEERRRAEEELRRVQAQLLQAQKMDAMGRLAGGVAHDFSNLLTIVLSYASLLLPAFEPDDRRRHYVEEMKRAGERGVALTQQLLAFSRQQVIEHKVLDLATIVREMDAMIRRLVGEDVTVTTVIAPDLGRIKADASSIEQVILNLVINARDAMPRGGKLTIEAHNDEVDEAYGREHLGGTMGAQVLLAISDTGVGMDQTTQQRIFEPFFTTKSKGKGTGLGLATVFGIVTQAGGNIRVASEPGQGTTFQVYLPRTDEPGEHQVTRSTVISLQGVETILVAEDEEQLRNVVRRTLERQGFSVLMARSGSEAIELCETHAGTIALLLTDLVMPGMSGRELADRLVPLRPSIKILYMSGYTENAIANHDLRDARMAFLAKPFTPESLLHKVRELLDGG